MHTATAIETLTKASSALDTLPGQLADAGFTGAGIAARLDERDIRDVLANLAWHSLMHAHAAEPPNNPCDVLLQLFVLNIPVPHHQFSAHVPAELQATLRQMKFLRRAAEFVEGTVSLSPLADKTLIADQLFSNRIPLGGEIQFTTNPVMPPHASTFLLLDNAGKPPGDRVVDLGCGSGVVGLLAADSTQHIVGIDIDPRAVAYSRLNAALNRRAAEYHLGDAHSPTLAQPRASSLLFNSPSGPTLEDVGQMTAEEAVRAAVTSARELLITGGQTALFTVLEVSAGRDTTGRQIIEWLGPHTAAQRIHFLESPHYSVSPEQICARTLDGRNVLVRNQHAKDTLWRYLFERRVVEIVPAVIEFTIT